MPVHRVVKPLRAPSWELAALLLAGAVSALGFAPHNLWPLPILALAFLLDRAFQAPRARTAFAMGWCFSVAHFLISLNWIAESFYHQDNMPGWVGWLAVILLSGYLALYPALACALTWRLAGRSPLGWVLLLAAAWMLGEWVRSWMFTGFAWNPLAVIWLALPTLAQLDQWVGPYALSGLVVLTAGALWLGLRHRWRTTAGVALAAALLGTLLLGRDHATTAPAPAAGNGAIPVHLVQPNITEDEADDDNLADTNLERYLTLSEDAHSSRRLLLWPEGALPRYLDAQYALIEPKRFISPQELAGHLRRGDILLTGGDAVVLDMHGDDDMAHNSVFAVSSAGQLLWRYDKAHLVPYGEYLPGRAILSHLGLSRVVPGTVPFSPGPGPHTFELPGFKVNGKPLTVALDICYEIIFPGRVVDEAHRPSFLYNPSNDSWFGSWGPPQHLAQARLRAIEEGLPVIRATPTGISAVISPQGEILEQIGLGHAAAIDTILPQAGPPTLFSRLGLWTSGIVGLLLAVAGFWASRGVLPLPRARAPALEQPPA